MDRVQAMRVFVAVVDCGGFTRAAQQLQLPRATVSSAVQQLEAQLGARLLHRTTRRVQLTLDGGTFYERCQQLLADFDELESLFSQQGASPRGKLRIDVPGPIGRQVLAPALPEFFRLYPGIELELGVTDRPVDLIQEGVDCVIRVGALAESRLVARRIGMLPQGNYASPDYLAAFGARFAGRAGRPSRGQLRVAVHRQGVCLGISARRRAARAGVAVPGQRQPGGKLYRLRAGGTGHDPAAALRRRTACRGRGVGGGAGRLAAAGDAGVGAVSAPAPSVAASAGVRRVGRRVAARTLAAGGVSASLRSL